MPCVMECQPLFCISIPSKPGDKPSIAGAHRLYEQRMRACTDKPMSNFKFSGIARDVLNQPQHQDLASRFPLTREV